MHHDSNIRGVIPGACIMIRKIGFVIIASFLVCNMAIAQTLEPLDLAKKIFSKGGVPNISSYVTGEYKGRRSGVDLPQDAKLTFALLEQTTDKAVVAMTVVDPAGSDIDAYMFFTKKTTWKMSAFRALALTGIIEAFKNTLEKMTSQQVDDTIAKSKRPGISRSSHLHRGKNITSSWAMRSLLWN